MDLCGIGLIMSNIEEKLKKRILTSVIDIVFIQIVVALTLEKSLILLFLFAIFYLIFIYSTGYAFGSIFTKNKIYWYGKKTPYLFLKRLCVSIFYVILLLSTIYQLKYNHCGQYEYDIKFKTYVNNQKCNNNLNKLLELNVVGFHFKWYLTYFGIYVFLLLIISSLIE